VGIGKKIGQAAAAISPQVFPFLQWWPMVNRRTLRADLAAGITGGIIVLPQGVAFAMIAGLPPIYGLYTAMVTPIVAGLFGSSWHLISGPTTAISLVIFASLRGLAEPGSSEFIELALVLTFLAGAFQLGMGLARFGNLVNFVSHSVIVAFTAGAALLIAISQLGHILGVAMPRGLAFHETIGYLAAHARHINGWVFLVAAVTLSLAIFIKRTWPRWPHFFTSMIVASVLTYFLGAEEKGIPLVGEMPGGLPPFRMPSLSLSNMEKLGSSAFAVALLGLMEAVAIARSVAVKTGQRLDSNQEFVGQGLSNVVGSFFSCYAASGSFTRTGVNHVAGAQTPMAAVFAALFLMLLVLFVAPLTAFLPIAAMGGVILFVAYNLIDVHEIRKIIQSSKGETTVLLATFIGTLFFDLELAIYVGVFLSLFFYLRRTSKPHIAVMAPNQEDNRHHFLNIVRQPGMKECPQLKVVRIDGSLFFGAIDHIDQYFSDLRESGIKNVLILAEGINYVDLAGAEWLAQEAERWQKNGGGLYVTGLKIIAQGVLVRSGMKEKIGTDHFFSTKKAALANIYAKLDLEACKVCQQRIFWECQKDPRLTTALEDTRVPEAAHEDR
jgi:sulfate permease, SulP family